MALVFKFKSVCILQNYILINIFIIKKMLEAGCEIILITICDKKFFSLKIPLILPNKSLKKVKGTKTSPQILFFR
jgi:hypothetical protein